MQDKHGGTISNFVYSYRLVCLIGIVILLLSYPRISLAEDDSVSGTSLSNENPQSPADPNVEQPTQLWNLENADIRAVINQVADITGKNFIVDPDVRGEVTVVSAKPLTTDEVYPVFLSILQVLGYAAIPAADGMVKIVQENSGLQMSALLDDEPGGSLGDELAVQVIELQYVASEQLVPILRPLVASHGYISNYAPANSLIISGRVSTIKHIASIVSRVDTFNDNDYEIEVIPIENAYAPDLLQTIQSLLDARSDRNEFNQIYLAADEASNTLLMSGNVEKRLTIRVLITQLDNRSPTGLTRETQVIRLKYLNANEAVPILASVARANFGSVGTTLGQSPSLPTNRPGFNTTQTRNLGLANTFGNDPFLGGGLGGGFGSGGFGNRVPFRDRVLSGGSGFNNSGYNSGFETTASSLNDNTSVSVDSSGNEQVEIAAEPTTNSIVVTAPPDLIRTLRNVLTRIDVRPAQVLVEALIVEISETRMLQLGVDWQAGRPPTAPMGPQPESPSMPDLFDNASELAIGSLGGFGVGFIRAGDIRLLIQALQTDADSHILSTPSLVVLDNQEAAISVGQTVAFPTGSIANSIDATNLVTTFNREDVALSLAVIPQINQGNSVTMQIFHENEVLDPLAPSTFFEGTQIPTTSKSEIQTSVIIEDGDILVLGGLISNQRQSARRATPFFSSIPLLGLLFQNNSNNIDRRNLMIFIRPSVMRNPDESVSITDNKYNYIRNQQISAENNLNTLAYVPAPWDAEIPLPAPFTPNANTFPTTDNAYGY